MPEIKLTDAQLRALADHLAKAGWAPDRGRALDDVAYRTGGHDPELAGAIRAVRAIYGQECARGTYGKHAKGRREAQEPPARD